ncbi:hypothetical protein ACIQ4Z_06215 [Peribacillus asahii]|uniref:hypothetical protein n=1 Tax=Peribacillus asahii TaxID=228899 RepID=UPI00382F3BA9
MQFVTMGAQVHTSTNVDSGLAFKAGQIFFGKVNKIYPNQIAEVRIGNQKLIATLEAPLQAGERYWLQVQSNEGKPVLKVLDTPHAAQTMNMKAAAQQLIAHLGITANAEAAELAEFLMRNQFPITKDSFQRALQWLKLTDSSQSGLATIKTMYVQQLPFVEDVFKALLAQSKGESLHNMLGDLLGKLTSASTGTATTHQLKEVLESLVISKQGHLQETGLLKLVSQWASPDAAPDLKAGAFSLLQKVGLIPPSFSEAEFLTKLVTDSKISGVPQAKTELAMKWQQGMQLLADYKTALQNGDHRTVHLQNVTNWLVEQQGVPKAPLTNLVQGQQLATTSVRSADFAQQPANSAAPLKINPQQTDLPKLTMDIVEMLVTESESKSVLTSFLHLLNPNRSQVNGAKEALANQLLSFSQNPSESLVLPHERAVLQVLASEFQLTDLTTGTAVYSHLKDIVKILGLQFEHVLAHAQNANPTALEEELVTLKPLLLKLLQEQQHPAVIKELAEQIVNRLTAQQIMSQENGPLQNVLLTLPLNIGKYETDVTLQWSGRRTQEGGIDPNYCRILFYLDLEQLKETVIDMQVQNRVIKVVVMNEQSETLENMASPYIGLLRSSLEQLNYKLSGVLFENMLMKHGKEKRSQSTSYPVAGSYNGVDVRI